jgi:adenylate cyclase
MFCGHMFNAGSQAEPELAARIAAAIADNDVAVGYGPLACGADILIAEALIAAGRELQVVLPFREEDFIAESVLCGGEEWVARYHACRDAAAGVHFATPSAYVGDDNQFAYNSRYGMGLAALRAQLEGCDTVQLAVVSDTIASLSTTGLAGTVADIRLWQEMGGRTVAIPAGPVPRQLVFPDKPKIGHGTKRRIRSILFADYKGFSRLGERELVLFMDFVMGRIARVLNRHGDHVEFRNTWGDALYAVIDKPQRAARIAVELQEELAQIPPDLFPPGEVAGMRIGVHYGPIWVGTDRITGNRIWYGSEVNRTARIEPVTPVGGVYCTDAFASALLVADEQACRFTPVGKVQLAKAYGEVELYRLERR